MKPNHAGKTTGQRLREFRTELDLSLRDIERRTGGRLQSSHVSQIETGKVQEPSLAVLRQLADALHMDLAELLEVLGLTGSRTRADTEATLVLNHYRALKQRRRKEVLDYMRFLVEQENGGKRGQVSPDI